jgi:NADPH-dependent ferric siderophore reductase
MPGHVKTIWRVRSRGDRMEPVIRELLAAGDGRSCAEQMPADDIWEVPEQAANSSRYAWLAGESGTVTSLRRHLVGERGMDRRAIAFMGYWRRRAVAA